MCSDSTVIDIRDLGKRYDIYARPADRLREMLGRPLRRAFGLAARDYHREHWALKNASLKVSRGETVAIIGQNGSGKSTLLQLVCGTLSPTTGQVLVAGRIAALLELGAGFNPEFSGRENIQLSGLLYGIDAADLAERYQSIVRFAEIEEFIDQPVKTYSSGMYVRLAFAIAAHVDADVLIVDEALSVGDVRFTQKCMRFLREFQKRGTLLFVSHDTSAVIGLCSRAVWLDHGAVRMDGPAKATVEAYLAVQHARDRGESGDTVQVFATSADDAGAPPADRTPAVVDVVDQRWAKQLEEGSLTRYAFFEFDPDLPSSAFGAQGATIVGGEFLDERGQAVHVAHGGEIVTLRIRVKMHQNLEQVIFGFYLKDRMGQRLFGDNSFLTFSDRPVHGVQGETLACDFRFRMPVLPSGVYSIDLAVASGSQDDHTQQHWIHDGLQLRASDTSMRHGLIGIPMLDISVRKTAND